MLAVVYEWSAYVTVFFQGLAMGLIITMLLWFAVGVIGRVWHSVGQSI